MKQKIYGIVDFQNNESANLRIENVTSSEILNRGYVPGSIFYNATEHELYLQKNNSKRIINTGNNYSTVSFSDETIANLTASIPNDKLTFKAGENIQFNVNQLNKTVTIKSNALDFSNNYSNIFGTNLNNVYTINHNLGSENIIVQIYEAIDGGNLVTNFSNISIIDQNNVGIAFPTAPGNLAYKAVISSNMGPQGPQGTIGATGPQGVQGAQGIQGPQGSFGNDVDGFEYDSLRLNSSNVVVSTSIVKLHDKGANSNIHFNTINDEYGIKLNHTNLNAFANVGLVYGQINYNSISPDLANARFLDFRTSPSANSDVNIKYYINGYGRITSKYLNKKSTGTISKRFLYSDNIGNIEESTIEIDEYAGLRKKIITINQSQILSSHSSPVELIQAPGAGKYINVHNYILHYTYGTTPYTYSAGIGLIINTASNPMFSLNSTLLNGTSSGKDAKSINNTESTIVSYWKDNQSLNFKSFTSNPTGGNGTIKLILYYTIEDS